MWPFDRSRPRSDDRNRFSSDAPRFRRPFYDDPYLLSDYRSRYTARYDSDRRSRSPRDRSPDRYNDRASQYSDGDRRRTSGDSRGNASAFQANRDSFRDSLTGREPPRGPKALIDPPSGPRGGGYGGDFRGRGRGRGRGWRDDSRDRGRDRDDFRDRRDPPFRDDRSRERERDWRDRDNFRGRRLSPQGRGRSPPGRDFRDRDGPLGVDADRARRESRDGPLSAGSSSSDPPFASQSYRGGSYRGRGGRGRGDWGRGDMDRGRGRNFYDDRDRFRSRSQEGRWGRDRDDRDNHRYIDSDVRSRDSREDRDPRDLRDRDVRPKLDRQSSIAHDPPPPTKDVSPPPLAPSAPAFGSVPSRQPSTTEIPKAPPTGPRALTEDRPVSAGQQGGDQRLPPSGPSKSLADVSPPIPTGPRAQQQKQQRPSSKQWINPALVGKTLKVPESPNKINRSQSFVASQQSRPFGPGADSSNSDNHGNLERRPRSSGANADSQIAVADGQLRSLRISEPGEITFSPERGTQSARASVDREKAPFMSSDTKSGATEPSDRGSIVSAVSPTMVKAESPTIPRAQGQDPEKTKPDESKDVVESTLPTKQSTLRIPTVRFALPPKVSTLPSVDHSSESDDEDIDDYFEMEIAKAEAELNKMESAGEPVPTDFVVRYANLSHEALVALATDSDGPKTLLGPLPEGFVMPREKPRATSPEKSAATDVDASTKTAPVDDSVVQPQVNKDIATAEPEEPKPKVEEMDIDTAHVPIPTVEHPEQKDETADVEMDDAGQTENGLPTSEPESTVLNGIPGEAAHHLLPPGFEQPPTGLSTPTQMEMEDDDDDETEIEEIDYATIETVRQYMKTPPLDDLPRYQCRPWYRDRQFMKTLDPSPDVHAFVASLMRDSAIVTMQAQDEARHEYAEDYEMYLRFTLSDDPIAVKSRDKFSTGNPNGEITTSHPTGHEGKPEGRRTGRFATERDLERALQESLQAENERREREERAQREKYRSEKEAEIPDMYWTLEEREKELFIDHSGFLPPERLVATWQVLPPVANFTEEEAEQFEKAYLEFPKQWGKIAENIPTRDFHSCIQYYYIKKKDLNLKEKLKKQPRRRKKGGRGKQRSSALVTEVLGIGDENTEENHETGENGERRRPRRAAAPTFGPNHHEATPAADSDGTATPGRRHAAGKNDSGAEKTDRRRRRGREKEPKQAKPAQVLAPTPPVTAKANRSRSNSRAQGPEFLSPQTPADMGRIPMQLDGSPGAGMQPPLVPAQPLLSPERAVPTAAGSSISEVMAPPSLRPEPPPPPPSVTTFEINQHAAPDRMRTPQQASSYWSVSESNEFPGLLRSFGTDWGSIAAHMQTKTHVMVKNYYVRQKDAGKVEWEAIAHDADQKRSRGEKLPPPPTMTQGPRNKRYDTPATLHRPLAAAEASDDVPAKLESHPPTAQSFSRFQVPVPIAQAPPAATAQAGAQPLQAQQQVQPSTQAMSPAARPLRAPLPTHGYSERDAESAAIPQSQAARISQKPLSAAPTPEQPQPSVQPRGQGWLADYGAQLNLLNTSKSRRADLQPKEEPRPIERPPPSLKQEPDQGSRYEPFAPREAPQPIPRATTTRNEPIPLSRSAEPPRTASSSQAYPPPSQRAIGNLVGEQGPPPTMAPPVERPSSAMQRPPSTSMQDPYGAPPPQQPPALAPPAARAPEPRKTSSLMALLNDDPAPAPPPPKRVSEMAGSSLKPSSSPPPQAMPSRAPPPSTAGQLRREETPVYSYPRSASVQSAIPSLKPYNPTQTQSPQPQHMTVQRASMVSPVEAASAAERDYYARHPYGPPQHQPPSSNSPQSHHYPPPSQHSQMAYQSQGAAHPYGAPVSQPHAASPTPQYAGYPSAAGRRDPVQQSRETAWPPTQRQEPSPASMQQQQAAWPPPKANQPPPTQSAWGAQHGAPPKPPPANNSMQQQPSWSTGPPPQHTFRDSLRDDRSAYPPVHDSRSPSDPRMMGHQHQQSLSGRYPPASNPRDIPPQAPQPAYPRYATPGPGQGRDLRDPGPPRSYTPVSAYDSRGPPPGPYAQEMQMRDPRGDPRDTRDPVSQLQRQLRPHEEYNRPPERRY